jgi:hypothetical protein
MVLAADGHGGHDEFAVRGPWHAVCFPGDQNVLAIAYGRQATCARPDCCRDRLVRRDVEVRPRQGPAGQQGHLAHRHGNAMRGKQADGQGRLGRRPPTAATGFVDPKPWDSHFEEIAPGLRHPMALAGKQFGWLGMRLQQLMQARTE